MDFKDVKGLEHIKHVGCAAAGGYTIRMWNPPECLCWKKLSFRDVHLGEVLNRKISNKTPLRASLREITISEL